MRQRESMTSFVPPGWGKDASAAGQSVTMLAQCCLLCFTGPISRSLVNSLKWQKKNVHHNTQGKNVPFSSI